MIGEGVWRLKYEENEMMMISACGRGGGGVKEEEERMSGKRLRANQ